MGKPHRLFRRLFGERGAEAVEFALVVPVILLIVFGAIEFGRLYNEQIQLTGAARYVARVKAIDSARAVTDADLQATAPALNPPLTVSTNLSVVYVDSNNLAVSACSAKGKVMATVNYAAPLLTGLWGPKMNLSAKAVMPCGG